MSDTAAIEQASANGSQPVPKASARGRKRPNNRVVGGSSGNLQKVELESGGDLKKGNRWNYPEVLRRVRFLTGRGVSLTDAITAVTGHSSGGTFDRIKKMYDR